MTLNPPPPKRRPAKLTLNGPPRSRSNAPSRGPSLPLLDVHMRTGVAVPSDPELQRTQTPLTASAPPSALPNPAAEVPYSDQAYTNDDECIYKDGPLPVLPGVFIGNEANAYDEEVLAALGITTILDLATEGASREDDSATNYAATDGTLNRMPGVRYFKIPWTHKQEALSDVNSGDGFVVGCAIITEGLGIDPRNGQKINLAGQDIVSGARNGVGSPSSGGGGGAVLVHCQLGISRSATMLVAFVMQAAALQYACFPGVHQLRHKDDCYDLVKNLSHIISPNMHFICHLAEWEKVMCEKAKLFRNGRWGSKNTIASVWGRKLAEEDCKESENAGHGVPAEEDRSNGEEDKQHKVRSPPSHSN